MALCFAIQIGKIFKAAMQPHAERQPIHPLALPRLTPRAR